MQKEITTPHIPLKALIPLNRCLRVRFLELSNFALFPKMLSASLCTVLKVLFLWRLMKCIFLNTETHQRYKTERHEDKLILVGKLKKSNEKKKNNNKFVMT